MVVVDVGGSFWLAVDIDSDFRSPVDNGPGG